MVKNPPANAGDTRDVDSIPGSGRPLGGGYSPWGLTELNMTGCSHTHTHTHTLEQCYSSFLLRWKLPIIKFILLKCVVQGLQYIHKGVQPSPLF